MRELARATVGAPFDLGQLVVAVDVHDEVIHRVFTKLERRELREVRGPSSDPALRRPRVDVRRVDPFAFTPPALRAETEAVSTCLGCGGAGSTTCPSCDGTGKAPCSECGGTGEIQRHYKTAPSKWIRCPSCRGAARRRCTQCGTTGTAICDGCDGSGAETSYWTFTPETKGSVFFEPSPSKHEQHGPLDANRPLTELELGAYTLVRRVVHDGQRPPDLSPAEGDLLDRATPPFDPATERVVHQQYVVVATIRREAKYRMSGMEAGVRLTGPGLHIVSAEVGAAAIRRRTQLWIGTTVALAIAGLLAVESQLGASAYFAASNVALWISAIICSVAAVTVVGAGLREWGARARAGRFTLAERVAAGVAAAAALAFVVTVLVARPTIDQARAAVARGDLSASSSIVEALQERRTPLDPEFEDVIDANKLLAAKRAPLVERLAVDDVVASRGGPHALVAAQDAHETEVAVVRDELAQGRSAAALALLDKWFPNPASDHDGAALRAEANDATANACTAGDLTCRFVALRAAQAAAPTPERETQVRDTRTALAASLVAVPAPDADVATRAIAAERRRAAAVAILQHVVGDADLNDRATAAKASAEAEETGIALLGNDGMVAKALFGNLEVRPDGVGHFSSEGTEIYLTLDKNGVCRGVYAVGAMKDGRRLASAVWSPRRIVSQAVGHVALVKPAAADVATWNEGGVAVVARYDGGQVVELRVGDAVP